MSNFYRFMIPIFSTDEICLCCKTCLNSFEKHAVHCKELSGFKYRHAIIRDVLFAIYKCVDVSAKKAIHVNFLRPNRKNVNP